jgi:hypothetical protein
MNSYVMFMPRCYCPACDAFGAFNVSALRRERRWDIEGHWSDLQCSACRTCIAALLMCGQGRYGFRRVTAFRKKARPFVLGTRFFCNFCCRIQDLQIQGLDEDTNYPICGAVLCARCRNIVTAVKVHQPGQYAFTRLALPSQKHELFDRSPTR